MIVGRARRTQRNTAEGDPERMKENSRYTDRLIYDETWPRSDVRAGAPRSFRKRDTLVGLAASHAAAFLASSPAVFATEAKMDGTVVFADAKNMFRLEYPAAMEVVNKAGATLLLRDPAAKYSTIGVTVSPVKISSLSEFGSVHEIGEKLLSAEAAKESTVPGGVTLISEGIRTGSASNTTFYDYDYRLITTHGNKRVLNSVAVENNMLYIMNAQVREKAGDTTPDDLEAERSRTDAYRIIMGTFDVGRASIAAL